MDKQLFDDKMTSQSEMRWDGGKNGPAWKSRIQSYMWSKIPALLEILKWAENTTRPSSPRTRSITW